MPLSGYRGAGGTGR